MAAPTSINLLPGDLLLFRGEAWVSAAIRWATRGRRETKTWANHAGIVGMGGGCLDATTIEALATVKERPWCEAIRTGSVQVWRRKGLTDRQREAVANVGRGMLGNLYGPFKIVPQFLDGLLSKLMGGNPYVFRKLARLHGVPICSRLAELCYWRGAGVMFWLDRDRVGSSSPDDLHDWCLAHPEQWEQVA